MANNNSKKTTFSFVKPENIRKQLNLKVPPFDIVKIVKKFGIDIYTVSSFQQFNVNCNNILVGYLIFNKDKNSEIYISDTLDKEYGRFYLAHAFGHFIFRHISLKSKTRFDSKENLTTQVLAKAERQANLFALDLLMPIKLIREFTNKGVNTFKELGQIFQLPPELIATFIEKYTDFKLS